MRNPAEWILCRVFLAAGGAQGISESLSRGGKEKSFCDFPCSKSIGPGRSKNFAAQQDATKLQGLWYSWECGGKTLGTWPAMGKDGTGS